MTFTELALRMYPFWIMGIFMMAMTYMSSHRELLRVEKKPVMKWVALLGVITAFRVALFHLFPDHFSSAAEGAMIVPWQITFTVFWEDAMHGLPLAIFARWLGMETLWKKILVYLTIGITMISFGAGHMYQGAIAAFLLSFYVPFTFKKGQEIGFGSVMICHILYDLVTILTLQYFLG